MLSDSGTINEEAAMLGFSALNLRETHERPEAMEKAVTIMVGLNVNRVLQGLEILDKEDRRFIAKSLLIPDYSEQFVSEKVTKILHSYCDFVKSNIWKN